MGTKTFFEWLLVAQTFGPHTHTHTHTLSLSPSPVDSLSHSRIIHLPSKMVRTHTHQPKPATD